MRSFTEKCSHIINIFDQEKEPSHSKGNLYLSGVGVLK